MGPRNQALPRCLYQQHTGARLPQVLLDVAHERGSAPLPLVIGVHGEQVEVPGAVGHPLRSVVSCRRDAGSGVGDHPAVGYRGAGQERVQCRFDFGESALWEQARSPNDVDDRGASCARAARIVPDIGTETTRSACHASRTVTIQIVELPRGWVWLASWHSAGSRREPAALSRPLHLHRHLAREPGRWQCVGQLANACRGRVGRSCLANMAVAASGYLARRRGALSDSCRKPPWKGGTVKGGACAIALATAKLPFTGLS